MKRFLLLALTAGLLSPIAAKAFFGEKEGTKVWSSHKILDNSSIDIFRTYDSFTEKAQCSHEMLDPDGHIEMGSGGTFEFTNGYKLNREDGRRYPSREGIEIKYGNNKPKPFISLYGLGFLSLEEYSKYRTVKLRFTGYNKSQTTHTINTSEVKKFIKSYKACERSTSK